MEKIKFKTVEEYMEQVPPGSLNKLEELRKTLKAAAPQAEEVISYNMPALSQGGMLVYYAAYKNHIGFYPTAEPIKVFNNELSSFPTSKGAVQFGLEEALPIELLNKIVSFRLRQIEEKNNKKGIRTA